MKKYFSLILTIIIFLISLVNGWFLDQLVDKSTFWGIIPSILLCVLFAICFSDSIKNIKRNKEKSSIIEIILLIINVNLLIFIPFREIRVNVDYKIFKNDRDRLIEDIDNYDVIPDENDIIKIKKMYSGISSNNKIKVYENDDNGNLTVAFYVSDNMPFKKAILMYSRNTKENIKQLLNIKEYITYKEIDNNWYFIEYKK